MSIRAFRTTNSCKEINQINRPGCLMLPWSVGWPVVMRPRHLRLTFARGRWCQWWWWWWGRVTSGSRLREGGAGAGAGDEGGGGGGGAVSHPPCVHARTGVVVCCIQVAIRADGLWGRGWVMTRPTRVWCERKGRGGSQVGEHKPPLM